MSDNAVTIYQGGDLAILGQAANQYACTGVFEEYRQELTANTRRRQDGDLALFEQFLKSAGVYVCNLASDAKCWQGVTWGLVKAFKSWQLDKGYAIGSIN